MSKNTKLLIGITLLLLLAAAFVFTQRNNASPEDIYITEALTRGEISTTVGATGTVRAYQSAMLTWKTSGVVAFVNAQLGDTVKNGDILSALEKNSVPQHIVLAEADLIAAQNALDDLLGSAGTASASALISLREAEEAYEDALNYRALLDQKVRYESFTGFNRMQTPFGWMKIPTFKTTNYYPNDEQKFEADQDTALRKEEFEDAQRAYDRVKDGVNKKDIAAAEARINAAQATLDLMKTSPSFDGVITDINVQEGNQVSAGDLAFRVDDLSNLLIDLEVPEVDINSISLGQEVSVSFEAIPEMVYHGVVVEIAGRSIASAGSVNFRVTVKLTDADEQVKSGMTATVVVRVRNVEDALLIPNRAIRTENGQSLVYMFEEDGFLIAINLRLGAKTDSYSEIVSGDLQEGDLVVVNPLEIIGNEE